MAGEDDVDLEVGLNLNEADARRIGEDIGDVLTQAFAQIGVKIGARLAKQIEKTLGNKVGANAFDGFEQGARDAGDAARFIADAMGNVSERATQAAGGFKVAGAQIFDAAKRMERLREDTIAFQASASASRDLLKKIGADENLLSVFNRELQLVQSRLRSFDEEAEQILGDPVRLEGLETGIRESQKTIFRQLGLLQSGLRNLNKERSNEAQRAARVEDRIAQERAIRLRADAGLRVVTEQGANAKILADTRIAGQQQIQQERIRARTRIELVRFTFRQIQTLERGIAGVFRATGTVANSAFRSLESATSRISGLFRRSNTDLNQGLIGALRARESSIDRSFDRQTRDIRRSTSEQSAIIQRFETQASTGIAGALSGRSALGSLLGGGLAIGGGFALFQGLRDGLEVGGDFVQGLSVLQAQLELTELQMQGVREQSIALGNDIALPGVSALDAAEAIQILAKQFASLGAGALPAAQAAAEGTLQLARATGVAAEEAARVVGAAVNVFGIEASEAVAVADQVTNALKNAAGVGFNDFADSFTQAASVVNLFIGPAQEANEALAETNAALAILAKGGIIGSDAGTSLKQFFLQANRGTADATKVLGEVTARAGELGSVFFDASGGARTLAESVDILRRGTEGLTDQQFSATLQKLFGSDAARSAAILIRSTAGELERLTAANLEQGSAAAIAAAQNVGLRGALDALGSVIETQQIKTYEKYQAVLGRVVIRFAELLQAFFEGRGIFEVIRAGLAGVGIGLGALLAAKGAAESIQFLTIALRALATPLGLLVGGITAVAAAFSILRTVSPEFRAETGIIADLLRSRLAGALEVVGNALAFVSEFLRTQVLPRLVSVGEAVARRVLPIFNTLSRVFTEDVVPALRVVGELIESTVLPPLRELGGLAFTEIGPRLQALGSLITEALGGIAPLVAPAVDGFRQLRDAIREAFQTGDTSNIATALVAVRDGVLASFRNLAGRAIDILAPQLERVVGFIADQLSPRNLEQAVLGVAEIVFKIGETLGSIVSDPRVVLALEALVGAFVATAAIAVAGFGKGVIDNLPELGELLVDQFQFLFDEIFEDGINWTRIGRSVVVALAAAIGTIALGAALIQSFRRPVEQAGTTTGRSFVRSLASTLRTGFTGSRNNPFAAGFFGGVDGIERTATRAAQRAGDAMIREQQRAVERLQLLNQRIQVGPGPNQFKTATDQWEAYSKRVGTAEIAGASFRTSLGRIFTDVGNFARAGSIAVSTSYRDGFSAAGTAARSFTTNVRQLIQNSIADFRTAGIGIGQALGGSIVSGVGAALAGQQLGTADSGFGKGLGLAGIISAAIFGAAAVGGGPQGLVVGGLIATIGLASAAMARSGEAAKLAAERIDRYADALRNADSAAEQIGSVSDIVNEQIGELDEFGVKILQLAKFDVAAFTDSVLNGATALEALDTATPGLSASAFEEAFKGAKGYEDILNLANDAQLEILAGLRLAGAQQFFNRNLPEDIAEIATGSQAAADGLNAATAAASEFGGLALGGLTGGLAGFSTEVLSIETNTRNAQQALDSLDQQRTAGIQARIADLTTELELARGAAQAARDELTAYLSGDYIESAREALDNLVLALPSIGTQIDEALTLTPTLQGAQLNQTLASFGQSAAAAIQRGIDEGLVDLNDPASVRTALQPFFTAIDELVARGVGQDENGVAFGGITEDAGKRLRTQLEGLISGDTFALLLEDIAVQDEAVAGLQTKINDLGIQLGVEVVFDRGQIQAAADALGLTINLNALPPQIPTAVTDALPGVSRSEQVTLANAQAQARADAEAERDRLVSTLADAVTNRGSVDTAERIGTNVEQIIINGASAPAATGSEVVLALGAVSGGLSGATRREVLPILAGSRF